MNELLLSADEKEIRDLRKDLKVAKKDESFSTNDESVTNKS